MKTLTVRAVAVIPGFALVVVPGEESLDRQVRSVHVIDLDQPTRYLLPNELVLTNGIWLERVAADEWIDRIVEAGASALGFGLGDVHSEIPSEVEAACRRRALPLLRIGADVSFTAAVDVLTERLDDGTARGLRHQLAFVRRLLQASVERNPYQALAELLKQEAGVGSAFVSGDGDVLASVGRRPRLRDVVDVLEAARERRLPATMGASSAFPTRTPSGQGSLLVVAAPLEAIDDAQRFAVEQVTAHAAIADDRRRERRGLLEPLTREVLELLDEGKIGGAALRVRLSTLDLGDAESVVVFSGAVSSSLRRALANLDTAVAVADRGLVVEALVAGPGADEIISTVAEMMRGWGDKPAFGYVETSVEPTTLRVALAAARVAARHAKADPHGAPYAGRVENAEVLMSALPRSVREAHAAGVLGPLEDWDRRRGSGLVLTLRTFLDLNGRWRETADQLGIHVNTLKHRLRRVHQLTGLDVDRTAGRVELWLALSAKDAGNTQP